VGRLRSKPKIFGIGLSKTGTSSLTNALNLLGIRTIHYPCDRKTFEELTSGVYRLSVLKRYQGVTDTPVVPFYPQLDVNYPGSKFILTIREKGSWLRSIEYHWRMIPEWLWEGSPSRMFSDFVSACVYGSISFNKDRFSYVYDTHLRNVCEYFRDRPGDFIIIDICAGEGWEKLCPFLGLQAPEVPFPHSNPSAALAAETDYHGNSSPGRPSPNQESSGSATGQCASSGLRAEGRPAWTCQTRLR
jgi:hypothetical protein